MIRAIVERISEIAAEEESGQAMTECVIVLPVQFFLIAGIMQLSLFFTAAIIVNHAAFKAGRAALVCDESTTLGAQENADRAATFICSTIAGTSDVSGGRTITYPGPSGTRRLTRSGAASNKTRVRIAYDNRGEALQVTVSHDYELVIPVVRFLFMDRGLPYANPHTTITEYAFFPCPWGRK